MGECSFRGARMFSGTPIRDVKWSNFYLPPYTPGYLSQVEPLQAVGQGSPVRLVCGG